MNEYLQEHLKILRAAADGGLPKVISQDDKRFSYDALDDLCAWGLMVARKHPALVDPLFINPKVTVAGRQYLGRLAKQYVPDPRSADLTADTKPHGNPQKPKWYEGWFGHLRIIAVGGVLVLFVAYIVREHLSFPL